MGWILCYIKTYLNLHIRTRLKNVVHSNFKILACHNHNGAAVNRFHILAVLNRINYTLAALNRINHSLISSG